MAADKRDELILRLYGALKRISQYQTPERLKKHSAKDWGLDDGNEALEYAYENVLFEAKAAIKGVRLPKPKAPALERPTAPGMGGGL